MGDLDAIQHLEARVFAHDRLSRRSLRRLLTAASCAVLVARAGDRLGGYALVLFRKGQASARLYSLAVDPVLHGRGVGRHLLGAAETAALTRGATALRLEVRTDNGPAIALYRAAGYAAAGRRDAYYEDGAPALLLHKAL